MKHRHKPEPTADPDSRSARVTPGASALPNGKVAR
jgi:hypothetical protein